MIESTALLRFSLYDYLIYRRLQKGIIGISETIEDSSAIDFRERLDFVLSLVDVPKQLHLELTCPGGDIYAGIAIYDSIKACPVPVIGVVHGYAASAASMVVLQACKRRLAMPNARILVHEVSKDSFGSERTTEAEDSVKEMKAIQTWIQELLSARMKRPVAEIKQLVERKERWMSAQEAKELGIIDGIVKG